MRIVMAKDHKLISTPVSVSDGFKRADGRTWSWLLIVAAVAVVVVVAINFFVEKPAPVKWPTTGAPQSAPASDEDSRTYEVAPPGSVPPPKAQTGGPQ
jgi:hypothetical protein